jgi:LDH2 family malate/lactate/ureidoglycolate dehydrogenase
VIHYYDLEGLRRFAAAMGTRCGLAAPRARALASHLLWYDAAGAASLGIASLPGWLEAIESGRVDVRATGRVVGERSSMAIFDGENGLPPVLLERAAELAVEKARETAVGWVRVDRVGPLGSAAAVSASIALGPMAGLVLGPDRLWSMAMPSEAGLPFLTDSGLAAAGNAAKAAATRRAGTVPALDRLEDFRLAAEVLVPTCGWLVAAIAVAALEPLAAVHERVGRAIADLDDGPGLLRPLAWEARRRDAHAHGVPIAAPAWKALGDWAQRLVIERPSPLDPRSAST